MKLPRYYVEFRSVQIRRTMKLCWSPWSPATFKHLSMIMRLQNNFKRYELHFCQFVTYLKCVLQSQSGFENTQNLYDLTNCIEKTGAFSGAENGGVATQAVFDQPTTQDTPSNRPIKLKIYKEALQNLVLGSNTQQIIFAYRMALNNQLYRENNNKRSYDNRQLKNDPSVHKKSTAGRKPFQNESLFETRKQKIEKLIADSRNASFNPFEHGKEIEERILDCIKCIETHLAKTTKNDCAKRLKKM